MSKLMPRQITEILLMLALASLAQTLHTADDYENSIPPCGQSPKSDIGERLDMYDMDPSKLFKALDNKDGKIDENLLRRRFKYPMKEESIHALFRELDSPMLSNPGTNFAKARNNKARPKTTEQHDAQELTHRERLNKLAKKLDILRNTAADRQFEHIKHSERTRVRHRKPTQRRLTEGSRENSARQHTPPRNLKFCQKLDEFTARTTRKVCTTTTCSSSTTRSPITTTSCPLDQAKEQQKKKICKKKFRKKKKHKPRLESAAVQQIMQRSMNMKKHSLRIIKNLNMLELELINRFETGSCSKHRHNPTQEPTPEDEPGPGPDPAQDYKPLSNTTEDSQAKERLDKPTTPPTTATTKTTRAPTKSTPSALKHKLSFYFGLRPLDANQSKEELRLALKEEQKLEQKVRKEQIQLAKEYKIHLIKDKIKRAHHKVAQPSALHKNQFELQNALTSSNQKALCNTNFNQLFLNDEDVQPTQSSHKSYRKKKKRRKKKKKLAYAPISQGIAEYQQAVSSIWASPQLQQILSKRKLENI